MGQYLDFGYFHLNGQIGSTLTNSRSVEIRFMRDFLKEHFLMPSAGNLPTIYHEEFMPIFDRWGEKKEQLHQQRVKCNSTTYCLSEPTLPMCCGMTIPI